MEITICVITYLSLCSTDSSAGLWTFNPHGIYLRCVRPPEQKDTINSCFFRLTSLTKALEWNPASPTVLWTKTRSLKEVPPKRTSPPNHRGQIRPHSSQTECEKYAFCWISIIMIIIYEAQISLVFEMKFSHTPTWIWDRNSCQISLACKQALPFPLPLLGERSLFKR